MSCECNKWVEFKKVRPSTEEQEFLCYHQDGYVEQLTYMPRCNKFRDNAEIRNWYTDKDITHYMKLPEGPKNKL